MAHHKLLLNDDTNEDFSLIAIHCSDEAYKMAFMINMHISLQLKRKSRDLDFSNQGLEVTFPIFEFENNYSYTLYNLVPNKCKSLSAKFYSSGSLFDDITSDKMVNTYLIPEYKYVDYFLKIHSDYKKIPIRKLVSSINEIEQVISAYSLESKQIKSKNNLIFD